MLWLHLISNRSTQPHRSEELQRPPNTRHICIYLKQTLSKTTFKEIKISMREWITSLAYTLLSERRDLNDLHRINQDIIGKKTCPIQPEHFKNFQKRHWDFQGRLFEKSWNVSEFANLSILIFQVALEVLAGLTFILFHGFACSQSFACLPGCLSPLLPWRPRFVGSAGARVSAYNKPAIFVGGGVT